MITNGTVIFVVPAYCRSTVAPQRAWLLEEVIVRGVRGCWRSSSLAVVGFGWVGLLYR
jgi:hypothetical protein